jgi:Tol biopolymer transport system component
MRREIMKNKGIFTLITGLFLITAALNFMGCGNLAGSDGNNSSSGTSKTNPDGGNTNGGGAANSASRIYFIKMAEQTEASGTLCFLPEGSTTAYTFPNKTMTSYSVSNDNTMIVFAEVLTGYSGTYLAFMNTDGTSYRQTHVQGSNPSFNSGGNTVYFDDNGTLYSMNTDGTDKQEIEIPEVSGTKRFPRISPDGGKLAFYQTSPGYKWYYDDVVYLYVYDTASGQVTKLNNNSIPVSYLNWNSDGTMIAFSTTTGVTPPVHELWTVTADGSAQPQRIADSGSPAVGACGFPSFSGDGFILCGSTKNKLLNWRSSWDGSHYKYELAKISSDGTALTILLSGYSIKDPVWVSTN